jgi:hypothetical protein
MDTAMKQEIFVNATMDGQDQPVIKRSVKMIV